MGDVSLHYITFLVEVVHILVEQHALKNVNNCLNTNFYSFLEASGDYKTYYGRNLQFP